jgi:hypothetical protein
MTDDHNRMALARRVRQAGAALAGALALAGCSAPGSSDPAPVVSAVAELPEITEARAYLHTPGLPTNVVLVVVASVTTPSDLPDDEVTALNDRVVEAAWNSSPEQPGTINVYLTTDDLPDGEISDLLGLDLVGGDSTSYGDAELEAQYGEWQEP